MSKSKRRLNDTPISSHRSWYEGSASELVFDYISGLFSDEDGIKDFSDYMSKNMTAEQHKGILETIADFFKELCDKITSYLSDHVLSSTAKTALEADATKAQEIRDMVMSVWQQAKKNYQSEEREYVEEDIKYQLNVFGLEGYTQHEKDNFSNGRTFFANSQEDIVTYINEHVHKKPYSRILLGKISKNLADRIYGETGVNIENYNVAITSEFENSHADEVKEKMRGQMAITPNIVALLPEIIGNYDSVIYDGMNKQQQKVLKFSKNIEGKKVVIEYVSSGRKTIDLHTMWGWENKKDSHQASDAKAPDRTFKTNLDMNPYKESVSSVNDGVKKEFSINIDEDMVVSAYINKNDTFPQVDNAKSPIQNARSGAKSNVSFSNENVTHKNADVKKKERATSENNVEQDTTSETVYSLHVDENIKNKAEQFKKDGYKNFERVKVLDVTPRINEEVKRLVGFDASDYEIYSNTDTYKHIENGHGENGTTDHSMKDIRDVALMPYVLKNFDSAELVMKNGIPDTTFSFSDKNGNPSKMIKFTKEINGEQHVVIAAPENKYKKLWVMSEYKEQKKDTSQPSNSNIALPPTSETHSDNVSFTESIASENDIVKKDYAIVAKNDLHFSVNIDSEISEEERRQIEIAEKKLGEQLDEWMRGKMPEKGYFDFGNTPSILLEYGAKNIPMIMKEDVALKFTSDYKGHAVALEDVAQLPSKMAEPVLLFKGSVPNSIVVVTDILDKGGNDVVVAMHLNKFQDRVNVNRIASIYGKDNLRMYVEKQSKNGNLLYVDKKRSDAWFTSRGLQLPKLVQTIAASEVNVTHKNADVKKKYSLSVDDMVVIEDSRYSKSAIERNYKEIKKLVRKDLLDLVRTEIVIQSDDSKVTVGNDFPNEYVGSNATASGNSREKRAKYNASTKIVNIIEKAKNPRWGKNNEPKHNADAKRGWRYYDVSFGVGNGKDIVAFTGKLNVRMDADGSDYVYDITDIKKGKEARLANSKDTVAYDTYPALNDKIASEKHNVKKNYSIDIDEDFFALLDEEYSKTEQEMAVERYSNFFPSFMISWHKNSTQNTLRASCTI